jgi:hypothetical protein
MPARRWFLALEAGTELALMKALVLSLSPSRYAHLVGGEEAWPMDTLPKSQIKELIWAIEAIGKYAPASINCLPRALALQRMLVRRGGRGTVRFGVRKEGAKFKAHAWLMLQDKILVGNLSDLDEYAPFPNWPEFEKSGRRR